MDSGYSKLQGTTEIYFLLKMSPTDIQILKEKKRKYSQGTELLSWKKVNHHSYSSIDLLFFKRFLISMGANYRACNYEANK